MIPLIIIIFIIIFVIMIFIPKKSNCCNRKIETYEFIKTKPSKVVLHSFDQFFVSMKSWDSLNVEIPYLSEFFTACIIPPISMSADDVGYIPQNLYDFNSDWGSEISLRNLLKKMNYYKIDPIADVDTQHRQGVGDMWFKYENPSFLDRQNISPDEYYKYIDTVLYNPWGESEIDAPINTYIDGLPPDYEKNGLKNCYIKNKDGTWSLYKDCRNKIPMYNIVGKANPSWLQSVNLCNVNVLKAYIKYIKIIKSLGVKGIRYDEADAISYHFISLFLNSDIKKTPMLLDKIIKICDEAKHPNVDKDVIYTFENDLNNTDLYELTSTCFDYEVIENFYGYLSGVSNKEKGWRGLEDMIDNINNNLNECDWTGSFDYGLKFMLNEMLNTKDLNIDGKLFLKENMLISNEKYKSLIFTFVDNHDTNYLVTLYNDISDNTLGIGNLEINFYRIIPAYFIIMLLPGIPMVHKTHFDIYKKLGIETFIKIRNELGIDSDSNFEILKSENNNISWKVSNLHQDLRGRSKHKIINNVNFISSVICEINIDKPTDKNIFSMKIYGSELWMKISIT